MCVLQSKSESHNGYIAYSSIRAFLDLLASRLGGTANLARPCAVQLEVDPLRMRRGVVQHVAQHLSLVELDELILFQQHALSRDVPRFPTIIEQYQSYTMLPHVGPHYT
jgi:hypothetical protein